MHITMLSGGVGGARMARGLAGVDGVNVTVVVNVADDDAIYGLSVSPDIDTVLYTLAGIEGPRGWGRGDDTWAVMDELARFPIDSSFRIGDLDLALNLFRTERLRMGMPLSTVTGEVCRALGLETQILPASDDPIRTFVQVAPSGEWLDFQTYFVRRGHADPISSVRFDGADVARPAPGVIEAIASADAVVVAPSNPVLSIWPILAIPGVESALRGAADVVAVSPLIGGSALKGPAADVLAALGYATSTEGVLAAYDGLVSAVVIDQTDADHAPGLAVATLVTDTVMPDRAASIRLAEEIVSWLG